MITKLATSFGFLLNLSESKYEVTAEEELYKYLLSADGFGGDHEGIKDGKLRFPSNLKIIATMQRLNCACKTLLRILFAHDTAIAYSIYGLRVK